MIIAGSAPEPVPQMDVPVSLSNALPLHQRRRPRDLPNPQVGASGRTDRHRSVVVTGESGEDGLKVLYIHIEARPGDESRGRSDAGGHLPLRPPGLEDRLVVRRALRANDVRHLRGVPNIAGLDAPVEGGVFRDLKLIHIPAVPAHMYRLYVLLNTLPAGEV